MDEKQSDSLPWLPQLMNQVEQALQSLDASHHDCRPAREHELQQIDAQIKGWSQSLANPNLAATVRAQLEREWAEALSRKNEIEALLAEESHRTLRAKNLIRPEMVLEQLDRLADVLASNDPTRGNLELSLHVDRITCHSDGRVSMRTCKLGTIPDAIELFVAESATADSTARAPTGGAIPRRRSRLRTEDGDESIDLCALADFAVRTDRFVGLADEWFYIDEFRIPDGPTSWAAENAEAVFKRRQQSRLPFSKLAEEFHVTAPTIGAAIRHYVATHPGEMDVVHLPRGGRRKPRIDVSQFAEGARALWAEGAGWSKEKLAGKFGCSAPVIDKALAYAYQQEGLSMPSCAEIRQKKLAEARQLFDACKLLEEIATAMKISDVTARRFLQESFAAEGKQMPDLRRRRVGD